MGISWTKEWAPSDDGTILRGVDLANVQDDIDSWIAANGGSYLVLSGTQTVTGDKTFSGLLISGTYYLGAATSDGSWRITTSGNDLVMQRRESGSWVTKSTVSP